MKSDCSCWENYPNESHKLKNGKWKCVDYRRCIQDHKDDWKHKTHCVNKPGYGPRGRELTEAEWMCDLMCGGIEND